MSVQLQTSLIPEVLGTAIGPPRPPITAVVLTFNEEPNLEVCLQSLAGWAETIVVVDSGSTDRTAEIAQRYGATFLKHPFESHAMQWKWGIAQLPESVQWILALDADQSITPELQDELTHLFLEDTKRLDKLDGLYINRRQVFRGRWIKHGGYYPKYLLKLFRRDKFVVDELDMVDHHFYVNGPTEKLGCDLIEENKKEDNITFWTDKHNQYAARFAEEDVRRRNQVRHAPVAPALFGSPDQRTLWFKSIWARLPLYVRPAAYFIYRYCFRLGFLDGKQGFVFHFLQGFWFRLLVDIKLDEVRAQKETR